ncbi:MAG: hypothetical protein IMZ69_00610 [Spirochaetes bacterium]|nr:hypothetical protein [Spirochaetota bacterium]
MIRFKYDSDDGLLYNRKIGGIFITAKLGKQGYVVTVKAAARAKVNGAHRTHSEETARVMATIAYTMGKLQLAQTAQEQMETFGKTGEMAPELRRFLREATRIRTPRVRSR